MIYQLTLDSLKQSHEFLKGRRDAETEAFRRFSSGFIINDVAQNAYTSGIWAPGEHIGPIAGTYNYALKFPRSDIDSVLSHLWQMVAQGMLVPRSFGDEHNQIFYPTEFGKALLEGVAESPADLVGFMKGIQSTATALEPTTLEFLREAIEDWLHHHLRSAAVMVGLASENEILKIIEQYGNSLEKNKQGDYFQRIKGKRNLKEKFDYLYRRLNQDKGSLPSEIRELDTWLLGIFHLIRLSRNDNGHPIGVTATFEDLHAHLTMFRGYARFLSRLKQHLQNTNT